MSLDVRSVYGALEFLLNEVVEVAAGIQHPLPERRYVTTGGAVYDCPQVSVSANQVATGLAGDMQNAGQAVSQVAPGWNVTIEMAVVRKAAEIAEGRRGTVAPSVDSIQLDTDLASADAALLTQAVEKIAGGGWDEMGLIPATVQFGEVQGGLTAVVLSITLNIWNFPPIEPVDSP